MLTCYFIAVEYIAVLADQITKEFRCYEAKIEESEKADSHQETNPGHLWLEPPVPCR